MDLFQLLNGNNYAVFNRNIAHEIGLNETLVLSEILDKYSYFKKEGKLVLAPGEKGEWFYLTAETIFERTTLTKKQQQAAIEKLIILGFIKKTGFGLPYQRHFQLCEEKISEFIISINFSRSDKRSPQEVTKGNFTHIYKRPIEETKEERSDAGASPPPPLTKHAFIQKENLKLREDKLKKLIEDYGEPLVAQYSRELQSYSETHEKYFKKYSCHVAVIRKWIERAGHNKKPREHDESCPREENVRYANIAGRNVRQYHENYKWAVEQLNENKSLQRAERIVLLDDRVHFGTLPEGFLYYDSLAFKEIFESNIRKLKK